MAVISGSYPLVSGDTRECLHLNNPTRGRSSWEHRGRTFVAQAFMWECKVTLKSSERKDLVKNKLDIPCSWNIICYLNFVHTFFCWSILVYPSPPLRTARNIKGDNYICKHIAQSITTITTLRPSASTRPLIKKLCGDTIRRLYYNIQNIFQLHFSVVSG